MRMKRFLGLWQAEGGLGAIEFALVAPFLLTMLLGILDFGMAFWEQMQIANAADAGAQWAMTNGYNATTITSVAQSATDLSLPSGSVSPQNVCGCASGTTVTMSGTPPCTGTCSDGSTPQAYVVVDTRICYSTLFNWQPLGLSYCSSGNSQCSAAGCTTSQIVLTSQSVVLQ